MKTLAIGGEPGVGKTLLVRTFLENRGSNWSSFGNKRVYGLTSGNYYVLGRYDDSIYSGTDALAMNVQPEAVAMMYALSSRKPNACLLFEGDRLFNQSFLDLVATVSELAVVVLEVDSLTLNIRHKERQTDQTEAFQKGRRTKVKNICDWHECRRFKHGIHEDSWPVIGYIDEFFGG